MLAITSKWKESCGKILIFGVMFMFAWNFPFASAIKNNNFGFRLTHHAWSLSH